MRSLVRPPSTLAHDLAARAERHGERTAVAFTPGDDRWSSLSYAGLAGAAAAVAGLLRSVRRTADRPQFVLIMLPNGLDYVRSFYGCLIAGAVAVPFYPPGVLNSRTTKVFGERLRQIWRDCEPSVIILPADLVDFVRSELAMAAALLVAAEDLPVAAAAVDRIDGRPDELALLQYTSGSTMSPKGVMVSHANLVSNVEASRTRLGSSDGEAVASWLPLFHDLGLIGSICHSLSAGMSVHLTTPAAFIRRPFLWLDMASRSRASLIMAPNFAYDLCVRWVTEEQRATLDLSHLRSAVIAAEPVRHTTIEAFVKAYERYGFRPRAMAPAYGMAEATLCVSLTGPRRGPVLREVSVARLRNEGVAAPADREQTTVLVGCGTDVPGTGTVIVDPERVEPCCDGTVGEIWVTGPGVAQGYWNLPELSTQDYAARLPGDGRRFLRTGDLGVKLDNELYVVGRIKDMIIQHGVNHCPQDLELTAEGAHPSLRPGGAAVFAVPAGTAKREERAERAPQSRAEIGTAPEQVVVLCELDSYVRTEYPEILTAVRTALTAEHGLEVGAVALVRKGQIPKTTSGKVRRRANAERWLAGGFEAVAVWSATDHLR
jgi:acyl-CoA synthetase (AMP-forming)/AMP-acid ligase II